MQLLFCTRSTHKFHFRNVVLAIAVAIQADDRASSIVDLLFITMRGILDLAALITFFDRGQHAAEPFDLAEFVENRRFYCALDRFHPGRSAQHVHGVLENSRLLEQDRLPVRGKPNPFFAWCGERLVGAIGMTRIRGVHVSQH